MANSDTLFAPGGCHGCQFLHVSMALVTKMITMLCRFLDISTQVLQLLSVIF